MTYRVSGINYSTLPTALLPKAKLQVRVDFTDDDALLTDLIGRAIGLYERKTGLSINAASAEWEPDGFDIVTADGVLCPVQPVSVMTVEDEDGNDVSADYTLVGNVIPGRASGLYLSPLTTTGTVPPVTATLTIGYASANAIPPEILDGIMRLTAHLYENREAVSDLLLREADWWADDLISGAWVPRA